MLGDYFTNDLLSGVAVHLDGRQPDQQLGARRPGQTGQAGAFVLLILRRARCVPMLLYVRSHAGPGRTSQVVMPAAARRGGATRGGRPRVLLARHRRCYLVWSLLPVLVAVLFSFNAGRSRTTWQGFSMRWYYGDPLRRSGTTPACTPR